MFASRAAAAIIAWASMCAHGHIWFPTGWVHEDALRYSNASAGIAPRLLTTSDCVANTSPQWMTGPGASPTFQSYHLHVAWVANNVAQVAAVRSFRSYLTSVAGASAACTTLEDTANYFCYANTVNALTSSSKQDPFYNTEMFIFVGRSFLLSALSFAMRCVRCRCYSQQTCRGCAVLR